MRECMARIARPTIDPETQAVLGEFKTGAHEDLELAFRRGLSFGFEGQNEAAMRHPGRRQIVRRAVGG